MGLLLAWGTPRAQVLSNRPESVSVFLVSKGMAGRSLTQTLSAHCLLGIRSPVPVGSADDASHPPAALLLLQDPSLASHSFLLNISLRSVLDPRAPKEGFHLPVTQALEAPQLTHTPHPASLTPGLALLEPQPYASPGTSFWHEECFTPPHIPSSVLSVQQYSANAC